MFSNARDLVPGQSFSYGFPDGPVAIHSNRTTYSDLTQNANPNEFMNPAIMMKNNKTLYIVSA